MKSRKEEEKTSYIYFFLYFFSKKNSGTTKNIKIVCLIFQSQRFFSYILFNTSLYLSVLLYQTSIKNRLISFLTVLSQNTKKDLYWGVWERRTERRRRIMQQPKSQRKKSELGGYLHGPTEEDSFVLHHSAGQKGRFNALKVSSSSTQIMCLPTCSACIDSTGKKKKKQAI